MLAVFHAALGHDRDLLISISASTDTCTTLSLGYDRSLIRIFSIPTRLHGQRLVPSLHGLNLRHVPSLHGLNLRHVPSLHGLNWRHVPSLHGLNLYLDNRTVTESMWAMTDLPSPFSLYQLDYTYYNTNSNVAWIQFFSWSKPKSRSLFTFVTNGPSSHL